ncbi:MAG: hypothetical protein ACF8XB_10615 [Planctomycetota bacterium JB042]
MKPVPATLLGLAIAALSSVWWGRGAPAPTVRTSVPRPERPSVDAPDRGEDDASPAVARSEAGPRRDAADAPDAPAEVIERLLASTVRLGLTDLQVGEILTVRSALADERLNPWGIVLDEADARSMQRSLAVLSGSLIAAASRRSEVAARLMDALEAEGRCELWESRTLDFRPAHAEEEVRLRRVDQEPRRLFRIQWGDDAEYDAVRDRIGELKRQSVEFAVAFLFEHGKRAGSGS